MKVDGGWKYCFGPRLKVMMTCHNLIGQILSVIMLDMWQSLIWEIVRVRLPHGSIWMRLNF